MDDVTLEEESKALLSDKAGETEYSQSLQDQIAKLKVNLKSVIFFLTFDGWFYYMYIYIYLIQLHCGRSSVF